MSRIQSRLLMLLVEIVANASIFGSIPVGWTSPAGLLLLIVGVVLALLGVMVAVRRPEHRAETLGGIAVVALIFGGLALYLGWEPWREWSTSEAEPQTITLQELLSNGYGDNRHVLIKDFAFCGRYFLTDDEQNQDETYPAKLIWIPAVAAVRREPGPLTSGEPVPRQVRALIRTTDILHRNALLNPKDADLMPLARPGLRQIKEIKGWRGRIRNGLQALTEGEKERLRTMAPDSDVDTVLLIDDGTPPPAAEVFGLLGAGFGWMALGVVLVVALLTGKAPPSNQH